MLSRWQPPSLQHHVCQGGIITRIKPQCTPWITWPYTSPTALRPTHRMALQRSPASLQQRSSGQAQERQRSHQRGRPFRLGGLFLASSKPLPYTLPTKHGTRKRVHRHRLLSSFQGLLVRFHVGFGESTQRSLWFTGAQQTWHLRLREAGQA